MTSALIVPGAVSAVRPAIVLGADNLPVPPTEIVERCKRIHSAIGLRFGGGLSGSGWAITWEWPPSDTRWARVQSGDVDPLMAYDIVGYLPFGCSIDQAPGYIERALKQYPRDEVRRCVDRMSHWNHVEVPKQQVETATTAAVEQTMRDKRQQNPRRQKITVPKSA